MLCAGSLGLINRDVVGGSRRQDFYDTNGQPVTYPDALFVDGTAEIERVNDLVAQYLISPSDAVLNPSTPRVPSSSAVTLVEDGSEPPFEECTGWQGPTSLSASRHLILWNDILVCYNTAICSGIVSLGRPK